MLDVVHNAINQYLNKLVNQKIYYKLHLGVKMNAVQMIEN